MQHHKELYPHLELFPNLNNWIDRWIILARELRALNADIYCLQEVEKCHHQFYYDNLFLNEKKFKGTAHFRENGFPDGCAIYWNPQKFIMESFFNINFNHRVRDLDKPNVAQIVRLIHKSSNRYFLVVNTHLLFNPQRGDIKLNQLAVLFAHIHKVKVIFFMYF